MNSYVYMCVCSVIPSFLQCVTLKKWKEPRDKATYTHVHVYIAVHRCALIFANVVCIWCDDVIDNVLSVPRSHTDGGEFD